MTTWEVGAGTATKYAFLPGKTYKAINEYDSASRTLLQAPDGSPYMYTYEVLRRQNSPKRQLLEWRNRNEF
jgi:hypothetical protein